MSIQQPIKWHGGKHYLAKWIISLMPPRNTWHLYREPYFGGGSVLLQMDPDGISEAVNLHNSRKLICMADSGGRLMRVEILNMDAVDFIKKYDNPRALFYVDPPYIHSGANAEYHHEMTYEDHKRLLGALVTIKGRFLLSGYASDLYAEFEAAHGWRRESKDIDNKSSSRKSKDKKTECVWMNY
jgi:DNA adenine methylase